MSLSDSDAKKVAIGNLLLRAQTNELAKRVISAYDPLATRSANVKAISSFNLSILNPCAEFLSIELADSDSNKLFTKDSLVNRIVFALSAQLPSACSECNETYTVELDQDDKPLFHCHMCFRGSHNCASLKSIHDALSAASISLSSGHVWLCASCRTSSVPIKPRKSKSRHDSASTSDFTVSRNDSVSISVSQLDPLQVGSQMQTPNQQISTGAHTVQFDETLNRELRRKLTAVSKERVCQRYKKGVCPHGLKGNKIHDGKKCDYEHPKYCIKYCRNGNKGKQGCNKGANCKFLHPILCKNSVKNKLCTSQECKFVHLKGTKRKVPDPPSQEGIAEITTTKELVNTASDNFLRLTRLVETMHANFSNEIASIRSSLQPLLLHQQYHLPHVATMPHYNQFHPQLQPQIHPQVHLQSRPQNMPVIPPVSS